MRWSTGLLLVALLAGCGEELASEPAAPVPTPVESRAHRFTAALPAGWHLAQRPLTPNLAAPVEILSAGTMADLRPKQGKCAHMPVGAIEQMGPRDALVTIYERSGDPRFPARPPRFTLSGGPGQSEALACARTATRLDDYWFSFRDGNRGFHVLVVLGREAPPERRAEALALLDSLRFEPGPAGVGLDSDLAEPSEDASAKLAWQMPVPPWRRYGWRMTAVQGERLMLGTFDLKRTPPDGNCTPRAAIDALPADGAFIYLLEYEDLEPPVLQRTPERSGPLTLGPEGPFECMGPSRMATWRDGGRAFQAHVYFGARASDRLRRDAVSILNSIRPT